MYVINYFMTQKLTFIIKDRIGRESVANIVCRVNRTIISYL